MGRQIDLLLPGLFWDTALKQLTEQKNRPKSLERALSRAKLVGETGMDLVSTLFNMFGVSPVAGSDLPAGAVTAFSPERQSNEDCWALATPVHLLADRDRLILIRLAPESIRDDYAKRLISRFNTHFEEEGLTLLEVAQGQWCIKLSSLPEVMTSDIESVAGRHIETFMPTGRDGGYWRSVLNEIQMLFYHEEVSQLTLSHEGRQINGIWLSGFGVCPKIVTRYSALFGSHTLLSGFARLSKLPISDLPDDIAEVTTAEGNIAILNTALYEAELTVDLAGWETALREVEQQLSRLLDGVDTSQDQLSIYTCKGHRFNVQQRWSIVDFFKGSKTLIRIMDEVNATQV
jgi:hypothetical protein